MVVDRECGQRRDVHAVFHRLRNLGGERRIESVDPFDKKDGVRFQTQFVSLVDAFTLLETVGGKAHFLAAQKGVEVVVEGL